MKLFVTGATGFVGRYVVAAAVAEGHEVVALVRPSTEPRALEAAMATGRVTLARGDLGRGAGLAEAMAGCDVVIHLAAVKGGDYFARFAGTVLGTETLLRAMTEAGVGDLVAISTFSVYDQSARPAGSVFDETFPVLTDVTGRDEYAETKLYQDELYTEFGAVDGHRVTLLRPGMIWGRDELWHPLLGGDLGPLYLRIGRSGRPPIVYVENVADAMVAAAEALVRPHDGIDGEVINLVDDELPTQGDYAAAVAERTETPRSVFVPWPVMRRAAELGDLVNRRLFDGRAKLPGVAVPAQLDARFKDFEYRNDKAKDRLGWKPRFGFRAALERATGDEDLLADIVERGRPRVAGDG